MNLRGFWSERNNRDKQDYSRLSIQPQPPYRAAPYRAAPYSAPEAKASAGLCVDEGCLYHGMDHICIAGEE